LELKLRTIIFPRRRLKKGAKAASFPFISREKSFSSPLAYGVSCSCRKIPLGSHDMG